MSTCKTTKQKQNLLAFKQAMKWNKDFEKLNRSKLIPKPTIGAFASTRIDYKESIKDLYGKLTNVKYYINFKPFNWREGLLKEQKTWKANKKKEKI